MIGGPDYRGRWIRRGLDYRVFVLSEMFNFIYLTGTNYLYENLNCGFCYFLYNLLQQSACFREFYRELDLIECKILQCIYIYFFIYFLTRFNCYWIRFEDIHIILLLVFLTLLS